MLQEKAKLFKALSDPNRLRILKMLQNKDLCVCEIKEALKLANSTVSQHLSILKDAGFVLEEKDGKWVNYMLNRRANDATVASVISMLHFWLEDDETVKADRAVVKCTDRNVICSR